MADLGDRALEFYPEQDDFIVDPAIHDELQGERAFEDLESALAFATVWLGSGS